MKIYQKIVALFLLLVIGFCQQDLQAQQLPFYTQSQDTNAPSFINGDYFKYNLPTQVGIRYRYQWTQVEGAPRTLNAHFSHWNEDYNLSIGGNLISDQTGPTSFTGIYGKAAYGIQISRDVLVAVGMTGGLVQYRINGDKLHFLEAGEDQNGSLTKIFPDFGAGATVYFDEKYYFGITVPQVFGLNLDFRNEQNTVNTERVRHYYANAGAFIPLYDGSFLEPTAEVRYVENTPLLIAAGIRYIYKENFWVGINGTSSRAAGVDAGVMWDTGDNIFKIGYALTNYFQNYGPNFGSTQEIGISVSFSSINNLPAFK